MDYRIAEQLELVLDAVIAEIELAAERQALAAQRAFDQATRELAQLLR